MKTRINPVEIFPDVATVFSVVSVQVRDFGENGSAIIGWQLCADGGEQLKSGGIMISGSEYAGWGSDDDYILELALSKLGLEKESNS